jgi:hypothetical protein
MKTEFSLENLIGKEHLKDQSIVGMINQNYSRSTSCKLCIGRKWFRIWYTWEPVDVATAEVAS